MAEATSTDEAYVVTLSEGGQIVIPKFMRGDAHSGERFLIIRTGDGYYLRPVKSLGLSERVREVQSEIGRAVRAAGLSERDVEQASARVRRRHRQASR